MSTKYTPTKSTQTPKGVFTVVAKENIGTMKQGQTGVFEFTQMLFSKNIMVYGSFGDIEDTYKNGNFGMVNTLYFYKPLTLKDCLRFFEFQLFEDIDFTKLFKDFKPQEHDN